MVKVHLQVIWLKAQDWKTGAVARSTGFKPDWVRRLVHRYNDQGPESLGDRRAGNGRDPPLSEAAGATHGVGQARAVRGLWSSAKVARLIGEHLPRHAEINEQLARKILKKAETKKETDS